MRGKTEKRRGEGTERGHDRRGKGRGRGIGEVRIE